MVNVRHIFTQIEIAFWTVVIRLMRESPAFQAMMGRLHVLQDSSLRLQFLQRVALIAAAGWLAGFLTGLLSMWLASR